MQLKEKITKEILPQLAKAYDRNIFALPQITKVTTNCGIGRVRERKELPAVNPAGYEIIARAFRRTLHENGSLYFDEAHAVIILPCNLVDAMPRHQIPLHDRSTKVQVAIT